MKVFVTGIAGFTGKHLVQFLEDKGVKVVGIDLNPGKNFFKCNLLDKKRLTKLINQEKPDYICHLASPLIRSDQLIDEALEKNLQVDLFGSINLLQAAAGLKQKPRILITGTAAVYQEADQRKIKETSTLLPITSYGLSKLTQELVCKKLAESYQLPLISTRTFLLVGPDQKPGFVITNFAKQIAKIESAREQTKTKPVLQVGNLNIKRDFTDVRDAVQAYWLLLEKGKPGETYNVCSGKSHSLKQVIDFFQKESSQQITIQQEKKRLRQNDPNEVIGDNRKISQAVGWKSEINFEDSLRDTLNYWRNI